MTRKKTRKPSADEKALWDRVAQTTTPLHPERQIPGTQPHLEAKPDHPLPQPTIERLPAFRLGEKAHAPKPDGLRAQFSERLSHAPVRMDHGLHKKMLRGKLKPEGRIDLHGKTLSEAHPALTHFILDAYDAGKRLVLVITGKGKDRDHEGPIPIRRGVLRHQVPGWLQAPPLGVLVLDVRAAHQRHGGEGAYYVYLKRRV
ncbi:MAG: Smr/MutS family protein [Pseudomonadota bacterium]